jgi:hypothetical protein
MAMSSKAFSSPSAMPSDGCEPEREQKGLPRDDRAWARVLCLAAVATLAAACDNSSLNEDETTFHMRALNLVEDSPSLAIDLDDTTVHSLKYGGSSGFSAGHPGRHDITFHALLPADLDDDDDDDDTEADVSGSTSYTFLAGTPYTLVMYGTLADIRTYMIEGLNQRDAVDDDKLVLQFTNASPNAGEVDVYITAADAGVATRQYVDTLALTESSTPLELTLVRDDADLDEDATLTTEVVIELIRAGTSEAIYRSAAITFSEQGRALLSIADSNGPGTTPVKIVTSSGGSYRHALDSAALKFVHVSHDTPALDITVGSGLADPLAQNVGFRQSTTYADIKDGENGMIAVPAGMGSPYVFFEEFVATGGGYYTAYAIGPASLVDAVVVAADARSVPTQAGFRFVHGAGSLEDERPLDLYLRLPGQAVDFADDDTVPSVSSLGYQSATSYFTLKQGDYDIYFAYAGTSRIVSGPRPFHVSNGEIISLVLMDDESGNLELMPVSDAAD